MPAVAAWWEFVADVHENVTHMDGRWDKHTCCCVPQYPVMCTEVLYVFLLCILTIPCTIFLLSHKADKWLIWDLSPDLSDSQTILPLLHRGSVDLDLSIVQQTKDEETITVYRNT